MTIVKISLHWILKCNWRSDGRCCEPSNGPRAEPWWGLWQSVKKCERSVFILYIWIIFLNIFCKLYVYDKLDFCDFVFKYSAAVTLVWLVLLIYLELIGVNRFSPLFVLLLIMSIWNNSCMCFCICCKYTVKFLWQVYGTMTNFNLRLSCRAVGKFFMKNCEWDWVGKKVC